MKPIKKERKKEKYLLSWLRKNKIVHLSKALYEILKVN